MDKDDWIGLRDLFVGYQVDIAGLVEQNKQALAEKDQIITQLQDQLKKLDSSNKL